MQGREAEYETVLGLLESTRQGEGKVLLVEGGPGTGKSLLLAAARRQAEERGFSVRAATAGKLSQSTPLAPLLAVVHAIRAPPGSARQPGAAVTPAASAGLVLTRLEELASAGPVLVTVDDVQWADPATMQAFQSMRRLLSSHALSWILTMGTSPNASNAEFLFDALEGDGAARITLGPLVHEAQVALIGEVLGAVPDAKLIELAADASGNPFILAETFRGLVDEGAITICGGHASLMSAQIPQRIQAWARDRLKELCARTRQFLETASILGNSFRLEDVAEVLGESPGALLATLEEALCTHLLVATPDGLAFQHEFIRKAVAQTLPAPIQQALHWQYGQLLLARRSSAVPAAYHLLSGARPGDDVALAGLDRAVAELLGVAPQSAAELATGALVLTLPSDPNRSARTVTAVKALTAAGQWDEAETLVRSALAVPLPPSDSAALRCALSSLLGLTGRPTEAMIEAQIVLVNFEITEDLRDDATIALLRAWIGLGGNQQVNRLAGTILAEASTKRSDVVVAAMVALALATWDAGKPTEALDMAGQAIWRVTEQPCEAPGFHPHLLLAARLIDVRRIDEAVAIMKSIGPAEAAGTSPWPEGMAEVLRARIALAAGRLDDAAAQAESVLRSANGSAPFFYESFLTPILATVALRRGDLRAAAEYAERLSALGYYYGSAYQTGGIRLVAAQVLEARRGPQAALDFLAEVLADLRVHRSTLMADPANAPWLVRLSLAVGDRKQAENIVSVISETSRSNPTLAAIRASAEHAEGLLASDAFRLQNAAAQHMDPWARACAAEDHGTLLAAADRRREAVGALDEALQEYSKLGAKGAMARTRSRLRQLGVQHRHWMTRRRPAAGWESLTDAERATARLVAQGLTNQQVASQLFVSTHTVAFHLRQTFRKLQIESRVELARITLEHAEPEDQGSP